MFPKIIDAVTILDIKGTSIHFISDYHLTLKKIIQVDFHTFCHWKKARVDTSKGSQKIDRRVSKHFYAIVTNDE